MFDFILRPFRRRFGSDKSFYVAIDDMFSELMLGSLAGDDTIIIVTESEEKSKELTLALQELL